MITEQDMQRAVRYYEGDIPQCDRDDPFWGDPRAYVSFNALLFAGVRAERLRIAEGKRLNPVFLDDPARLFQLYRALIAAADRCRRETAEEGFRVERAEDFAEYREKGETQCFTSTCRSGFLPAYGDKKGIVLLRMTLPPHTPCIVFGALLTDYRKAWEDELLLPPFLPFACAERPLTEQERRITDMNGDPPRAAYELTFTGDFRTGDAKSAAPPYPSGGVLRQWLAFQPGKPEAGAHDLHAYIQWKDALRGWLRTQCPCGGGTV